MYYMVEANSSLITDKVDLFHQLAPFLNGAAMPWAITKLSALRLVCPSMDDLMASCSAVVITSGSLLYPGNYSKGLPIVIE